MTVEDTMIAGIARSRDASVATRNTARVEARLSDGSCRSSGERDCIWRLCSDRGFGRFQGWHFAGLRDPSALGVFTLLR
jgi:hypothetical protein